VQNKIQTLLYHIKNAPSPELEFMRISILSSLLQKAKENIQKNNSPLCIYEFNIPHQKDIWITFSFQKRIGIYQWYSHQKKIS
jgi:hypothetical protein